ncbi:MAG: DUF1565 domain-containing protein [Microcoleaceae cyanobacterium]
MVITLATGLTLAGIVPSVVATPLQPSVIAQQLQASPALHLIYVSANTGNDSGQGTERSPLRTITQALGIAKPNTAIILAPGTYSTQTGEQFPLIMRSGVTIQGNPNTQGQDVVVVGGGWFTSPTFAKQSITVLGANSARLSGVTITNPSDRGYGLWIESSSMVVANSTFTRNTHDGISVVGNSSPLIQDNRFTRNGANGITVYGSSRPEIRNNEFQDTGFGINVAQQAAPFISGNRIIFNKDGVVIQANARPILRDNYIERNQRDGVVAIAQAIPDLGSSREPGRNLIQNNGRYDVHNGTKGPSIQAHGNQVVKLEGSVEVSGSYNAAVPVAPLTTRLLTNRANETGRISDPSAISPVNTSAVLPVFLPNASQNRPPAQVSVIPETAIPITVPQPESRQSIRTLPPTRSSRRTRVQSPASQPPRESSSILARFSTNAPESSSSRNSVPIPVPAPESNRPSPSTFPNPNSVPNLPSSGVLPVPRMSIPVSGEGYVPTDLGIATGGVSPIALGLKYRVVVVVEGDGLYQRVQAVIPEAFQTELEGRQVIQVGAFRDRTKADEVMWLLKQRGISAQLEPFN